MDLNSEQRVTDSPAPDPYADIRPYEDAEVAAVLERLGRSRPLHQALVQYRFGRMPLFMQGWLASLLGAQLRRHFAPVTTVHAFQSWLEHWVETLIRKTTTEVTIRGLDQLSPDKPHLWLSNHRDIAMDPTLVNFALMQQGWPTAQIAIGDNLLQNPVLSDVMRLNKSFLVRRSLTDRREKLRELQKLSSYIQDALNKGHSVWLAQREGRAKDNLDRTDTAVLKMLTLSGRDSNLEFTEAMRRLNPVPVVIQYEWDPCDVLKARELVALAETGEYQKKEGEDTLSMMRGLSGHKGRVCIGFGRPLTVPEMETPQLMAAATDAQIRSMSVVFPVSHAALMLLQRDFGQYRGLRPDMTEVTDELVEKLQSRYAGEERAVAVRLLCNYAVNVIDMQGRNKHSGPVPFTGQ